MIWNEEKLIVKRMKLGSSLINHLSDLFTIPSFHYQLLISSSCQIISKVQKIFHAGMMSVIMYWLNHLY